MKKREEKNLGRMIVGKMMGEEKIGLGLKTLKLQFLGFNPGPFFSYHFAVHHFAELLWLSSCWLPIPLSPFPCPLLLPWAAGRAAMGRLCEAFFPPWLFDPLKCHHSFFFSLGSSNHIAEGLEEGLAEVPAGRSRAADEIHRARLDVLQGFLGDEAGRRRVPVAPDVDAREPALQVHG